ncbi:hypothetical protein D9756_009409 [Leucocoprinus leucothites]|uniref:Protein kinase domain-containing protein n=1 Tax=Leucocoprinus leucothites TaxID=201217 RepID=A0A8H5FTM1_9AGAR|nr:hypothetical protein D9756_009409 [Leucoagaricus leucothites]
MTIRHSGNSWRLALDTHHAPHGLPASSMDNNDESKAPEVPKARPLVLVLLGDPGVGKSSFLNASKGDAVQSGPRSDDYGIKTYSAVRGSIRTEVQLYDPRGTTAVTVDLFGVDGVLVLCDLTKYKSFSHLPNWLNKCKQYEPPVINKLLVGNKSDLESLRTDYASDRLHVPFTETSAITKANVEEAIQYLVTKIMDRYWPETASAGQVVLHSTPAMESQPAPQPPSRSISENGSAVDAQARLERMGIQSPPLSSGASSGPKPESLELPGQDMSSLLYINPNQEPMKPETVFKRIREVLNDSRKYQELLALQGDYAQAVLDLLQKVLDRQEVSGDLKNSVFTAIKQLSKKTGLYPSIPTLQVEVQAEDEPIAMGTFSDTWKASYGAYPVCLKIIRVYSSVVDVERLIAECVNETLAFSNFEHPNILPFYGIFCIDDFSGWTGMVTPWMQNGTFHEYLDSNPEAPRLPLVYDMLEGLGYLHAQSVIHGNLRAANVLITPTGTACIADYGLCSVMALASNSEIQGSNLRWKAPELMEELQDGSFPSPTPSSDVYSAASVMYEILVGNAPFFELKHDSTVVSKVAQGIRPTKPFTGQYLELSDEIWAIMMQSWSGTPTRDQSFNKFSEVCDRFRPCH